MIGALRIAGMGLLLVASPSTAQEDSAPTRIFSCHFVRSEREAAHPTLQEDLRIVQSGSPYDATGRWTLSWPGQAPLTAEPFEASFGSVGGSVGLQWTATNGKAKKAFISFSDIHSDNDRIYFWLSLDRPSLWQSPGYVCGARSAEPSGAKS
ncbi:MAG TPA: hypothetical protein VGF77_17870 [Allosphingosinicella sp.]|jgi:hypothetical protein